MSELFKQTHSERKPKKDEKPIEIVAELDPPRPKQKWKFTVKRDDDGRLSEILAEEL